MRYDTSTVGIRGETAFRRLALVVFALLLVGCTETSEQPVEGASPLRVRLLTAEQYHNTIEQVFGADVAAAVIAPVPPLTRTNGLLSSGAAFVGVTSDQIQQIQQSAATIAARVVDPAHRAFLIPCEPLSTVEADDACAAEFLRKAGRLLYRRSVDETKVQELVDIANASADELADFYGGLALALEAMLISPEYLFIADAAEPDPARPDGERLDGYSLASRLSFFFWNAGPDDELLTAAESGELHTRAGLERQVDRLLSSSRLEDGMRAFFDDMMAFDDFDRLGERPQRLSDGYWRDACRCTRANLAHGHRSRGPKTARLPRFVRHSRHVYVDEFRPGLRRADDERLGTVPDARGGSAPRCVGTHEFLGGALACGTQFADLARSRAA